MASATNPVKSNVMDLMLGGLPAAAGSGQQQAALAAMLGPGQNLSPYLRLGGPEYADQLDQLMMNPMNAWFTLLLSVLLLGIGAMA